MDKETIKRFLKLLKGKIFLFLMLFTILFSISASIPNISIQQTGGPEEYISFWESLHDWEYCFTNNVLLDILLFGLPILIISFLFSSIIFFICGKYKNTRYRLVCNVLMLSLIVIIISIGVQKDISDTLSIKDKEVVSISKCNDLSSKERQIFGELNKSCLVDEDCVHIQLRTDYVLSCDTCVHTNKKVKLIEDLDNKIFLLECPLSTYMLQYICPRSYTCKCINGLCQ